MSREFIILLCAAVFVCGSPSRPVSRNASTQFALPNSTAANTSKKSIDTQPQDNDASSSIASYQSVVAPPAQYLPTSPPSYEVKSAVVQTISEPTPIAKSVSVQSYGSSNANQPSVTYSTSVATDPDNNNILESYVGTAPQIKPYYSIPVAAKTITVDSHIAGEAYNSAAYSTHGHSGGHSVAYSSNTAPVNQYYAVPLAAKTVESHGAVNVHPSTNYATYHHNAGNAVAYTSTAAQANQYYSVPLAAKTIESHGAVNVHSPSNYATYNHNAGNAVAYTSNAAQASQYYSRPLAAKKITVESHRSVNVHPSSAYATQHVAQPHYAVPLAANTVSVQSHGSVAAHAPVVSTFPVNVPVATKSVTIEAYNSVTSHPRPAPKYAASPVLIKYAPAPLSVPVEYQTSAVETNHSPTGGAVVQYNPVPVPVVHAESFVEKVYSPVGPRPTPVVPSGHGNGYARAVAFSDASQVSRVTFNGLGVSYGW